MDESEIDWEQRVPREVDRQKHRESKDWGLLWRIHIGPVERENLRG